MIKELKKKYTEEEIVHNLTQNIGTLIEFGILCAFWLVFGFHVAVLLGIAQMATHLDLVEELIRKGKE